MFPLYDDFYNRQEKIAVVGMGYVGLPLAVCFAEAFDVIGLDINATRVNELSQNYDRTREVDHDQLASVKIDYTANPEALKRLAEAAIPNAAGEFAVRDPQFAQAFNDVMMPNIKEINGEKYWHSGYRATSVLAAEGIILARAGQAKTLATRMVKEKDNSKETVDKAYRVIVKGE